MSDEKSIYDLELHETKEINGRSWERVPSGWLVITFDYYANTVGTCTFVPYDNCFQIDFP